MHLIFTPCRMEKKLSASISGDSISLNGEVFNFGQLQEGEHLPRGAINSEWIVSDVTRTQGELFFTLLIPHGADAPVETLFPENFDSHKRFNDGVLAIPAYQNPKQEEPSNG